MDYIIFPEDDDNYSIHSSQLPISATQNTTQREVDVHGDEDDEEEEAEERHPTAHAGATALETRTTRETAAPAAGNGDNSSGAEQETATTHNNTVVASSPPDRRRAVAGRGTTTEVQHPRTAAAHASSCGTDETVPFYANGGQANSEGLQFSPAEDSPDHALYIGSDAGGSRHDNLISSTKSLGQESPKSQQERMNKTTTRASSKVTEDMQSGRSTTANRSGMASSIDSDHSEKTSTRHEPFPGSYWFDTSSNKRRNSVETESPSSTRGWNSVSSDTPSCDAASHISDNTARAWNLKERKPDTTIDDEAPQGHYASENHSSWGRLLDETDQKVLTLLRQKSSEGLRKLHAQRPTEEERNAGKCDTVQEAHSTDDQPHSDAPVDVVDLSRSMGSDTEDRPSSFSVQEHEVVLDVPSSGTTSVTSAEKANEVPSTIASSRARKQLSTALECSRSIQPSTLQTASVTPSTSSATVTETEDDQSSQHTELTQTPRPVGLLFEELNENRKSRREEAKDLHVKFSIAETTNTATISSSEGSATRRKRGNLNKATALFAKPRSSSHSICDTSHTVRRRSHVSSSQPAAASSILSEEVNEGNLYHRSHVSTDESAPHPVDSRTEISDNGQFRTVKRMRTSTPSKPPSRLGKPNTETAHDKSVSDVLASRNAFAYGSCSHYRKNKRRHHAVEDDLRGEWHDDAMRFAFVHLKEDMLINDIISHMQSGHAQEFIDTVQCLFDRALKGRRVKVYWKLLTEWFSGYIKSIDISRKAFKFPKGESRKDPESVVDALEQVLDNVLKPTAWIEVQYDDRDSELMPWNKREIHVASSSEIELAYRESTPLAYPDIGPGTQMACDSLMDLASDVASGALEAKQDESEGNRSGTPVLNTEPLYRSLDDAISPRDDDDSSESGSVRSGNTAPLP
eukprot:gb/GECG01014449.1/.p1 GENE.gb/GECG01014449.1/~~gb/GECG01014449.1/.p1  ORF type:complete len:915 (+),score=136.69 gb/GECG01014449.1/:1-2745(+)